ncbi:Clan CD, family C13, asparaginyl endopeptidase-like cysteine peptidase [Tritrichomonas foetus]|uniref:Clan CD, family C13, asparaginyl endopeptidase-like cysteine peptidase n=1 Tax=Tritrichomonas foetus TaxID=1144522 RepID=A0A1J4K4Z4_9EUKA|nr:Clan CD, family C13, asparaginyl endopeptidase-like cysteine peptidase [Tritrichomonas foetus]|eukprot:OHT06513.1 Clan CD, family C13, asparaginyl endopeptidase-like cysteine peptidase [Tritrichomonas foetus]
MAYDDLADDVTNPFLGNVYHTLDHKVNVYPGATAHNYRQNTVTAESFYQVISEAPTTEEDYVYIYYDNHGGPGILGTPVGDYITTIPLDDALNALRCKNCLFGIEACYSGSLAQEFTATKVATITAANDQESSYAAVYDPTLGTYLSNEFTNYWIDFVAESPSQTVGQLFEDLKKNTEGSHVMYYGDESLKELTIDLFMGTPNKVQKRSAVKVASKDSQRVASEKTLSKLAAEHEKPTVRAKARLEILRRRAQTEKLDAVLDMLVKYLDPKNYEKIMSDKSAAYTPAYYEIVKIFSNRFGEINPDDFGRFFVLKALAASHPKNEIVKAIFAVL